ncbi:hypothetical protein Hypma_004072 [Hypsizygus marmoreus]|uniref:Uncharacterized protein n=1 Tax=Hypsizygus marmoreus TaxID=39966 RepID=A0A369J4M6_HYPMA|nr:hypothetical protein Hypma_004072 [Hypsizygus marmoreus]
MYISAQLTATMRVCKNATAEFNKPSCNDKEPPLSSAPTVCSVGPVCNVFHDSSYLLLFEMSSRLTEQEFPFDCNSRSTDRPRYPSYEALRQLQYTDSCLCFNNSSSRRGNARRTQEPQRLYTESLKSQGTGIKFSIAKTASLRTGSTASGRFVEHQVPSK